MELSKLDTQLFSAQACGVEVREEGRQVRVRKHLRVETHNEVLGQRRAAQLLQHIWRQCGSCIAE